MSQQITIDFQTDSPIKLIPLTQGKVTVVSEADYDHLAQYKWYANRYKDRWYVCCHRGKKVVLMHRLLLGIVDNPKLLGDHINGDGLNNTRENIRIATRSENNKNKHSHFGSTSKYLGVSESVIKKTHTTKSGNKVEYLNKYWRARITICGRSVQLGRFKTEVEAALCYDNSARIIHGEFANLNFK